MFLKKISAQENNMYDKNAKGDMTLTNEVNHALWMDDILRALEYSEIDVRVKSGTVYLSGHIVNTTSQSRVEKALRAIPGILGIKNNLVLDDKLTFEVATSLGKLEHIYGCKFFTGASHGVISLNGMVSNENVKHLAEQCAASNSNVRGVINNVHVSGSESGVQVEPFLQPAIGEIIYFLDGISGVVSHVIINPNNRRVTAMIMDGEFTDQRHQFNSPAGDTVRPPVSHIVVPIIAVRYLTKVSGFLNINTNERNQYWDFDPVSFRSPGADWIPPHPYSSNDVLFPVEQQELENTIVRQIPRFPLAVASKEQLLWEQIPANENLGG